MVQQLPAGVTTEMLARIAAFFATQPQNQVKRPSGVLRPDQIRGVNPNYRYEYREYPKALNPPTVTVNSAADERLFRSQYKVALPWTRIEEQNQIISYYAQQAYPKVMSPPQIVVNTVEEEEATRAAWRTDMPLTSGVIYPRWMFHAEQPAKMVNTVDQEVALGKGWYPTPAGAQNASKGIFAPSTTEATQATVVEESHDELISRAQKLGISGVDKRWTVDRLKAAIQRAEQKAAA